MPAKKNSTYNVAVIGAGAIGLDHIRSFQSHPAARVTLLAEVSPERGREAADQFNIPDLVTDYKEALKRPYIDVISIALPNYLHASVGLEALKAGKHLMLDKPMATTPGTPPNSSSRPKRKNSSSWSAKTIASAPTCRPPKSS